MGNMEQEHSDRARYVTEQVALWIENDGHHADEARQCAKMDGEYTYLAQYCTRVIKCAARGEAAWHVLQEMAPNDWVRVHWDEVAASLLAK